MGSYGIGVSRAVAAIAEQSHDEKGLVWPREVAPVDVHVIGVGKGEQKAEAEKLAAALEERGLNVLLDDRPKVSPGVAFKDAELIGVPTSVVIGRGRDDGEVELRDRRSGETRTVPFEGLLETVLAEVRG
jgi:prolyl-tRNA synthetase